MGRDQVKKILKHARIALDTNLFIYALEGNKDFPAATEIFRLLPKSNCEVYTSVISVLELTVPLYRVGEASRLPDYLDFVSGQGRITIVNVDRAIALKAAELRAQYNIRTPDAIQLAVAVNCRCDVFVTSDKLLGAMAIAKPRIITLSSATA